MTIDRNREFAKELAIEILERCVSVEDAKRDYRDASLAAELILAALAKRDAALAELVERIDNYLVNGGNWNPEMMEHDKVRQLLLDCRCALLPN
jgi:hypothetical protein